MYQVVHLDNVQSRYTRRDPLELPEWKKNLEAPGDEVPGPRGVLWCFLFACQAKKKLGKKKSLVHSGKIKTKTNIEVAMKMENGLSWCMDPIENWINGDIPAIAMWSFIRGPPNFLRQLDHPWFSQALKYNEKIFFFEIPNLGTIMAYQVNQHV